MRLTSAIALVAFSLGVALSGQSPSAKTQPGTFHVRGTVTDPTEAVIPGATVTFQGQERGMTVTTNDSGAYEADLPLGDYTMTAARRGFPTYNRPLFRVSSPMNLMLDATLTLRGCGDMVIVGPGGRPPTDDEMESATRDCRGEDTFPIAFGGVPLKLSIRFGNRTSEGAYAYSGEKGASYQTSVFVAYNLFSLRANHVVYKAQERTIEASGDVVIEDESGRRKADAAIFRIGDGRATQLH